jgi:hypothetical protein
MRKHFKGAYRSGLEELVSAKLQAFSLPVVYEEFTLKYSEPQSYHRYTPDFYLQNGIVIETKGLFTAADRKKHLLVKEQYPELDLRFVFSNSRAKLSKKSATTYGDWCTKNGFLFADKTIPDEWIKEARNVRSAKVIMDFATRRGKKEARDIPFL